MTNLHSQLDRITGIMPVRGRWIEYLNGVPGERYVRRVSVGFIRTDHSDMRWYAHVAGAGGDVDGSLHGEDDLSAGVSDFVVVVALDHLLEG